MKKKILFAAYSLDIGGIETALITLLNYLAQENYEITLVLEKKQGIFLNKINSKIKIIEYSPSYDKIKIISKIKNAFKRFNFIRKYKNKYDFACSYATYSLACSFIARTASQNNALWVHNNYLGFFDNDEDKYKNFFEAIKSKKFTKVVFVSNEAKIDYSNKIDNECNELITCNNFIDSNKILEESKEKIQLKKSDYYTFLNIGRHDEKQKKISRLLKVCKRLMDDGYKFRLIMVGQGVDTERYKMFVEQKNLNEYVKFIGAQKNPYAYYKECDCVVLTSEFEGYPVVFIEALIMNKPIITTNVSDSKIDIDGKYGLVCDKSEDDIYNKMRDVIMHGYKIEKHFDSKLYNDNIKKKVMYIIGEENNETN